MPPPVVGCEMVRSQPSTRQAPLYAQNEAVDFRYVIEFTRFLILSYLSDT
jgi:hypothetical protein